MQISEKAFVLYVEDDPQEALLVKALAETIPQALCVETVTSFSEAQEYLEKLTAGVHGLSTPNLLLVDYNLGPHTGAELLEWMQMHPSLRFPTAIFSNCDGDQEILNCYKAGANYFLNKPRSAKRMQALLARIHDCIQTGPDFEPLRLLEEYRAVPGGEQFSQEQSLRPQA